MTIAIGARFPTGRYHATPWGRSVNEGAVEWPPSSWRLLRALYATWKDRAPELSAEQVEGVLAALVAAPSYRLPRRGEGHTRHYYPDTASGTDKVFDPFGTLDPAAEVVIRWPALLPVEQRGTLARLCELLPYLGRADSLCQARVLPDDELTALGVEGWCEPGDTGELHQPSVRVLAPTPPLDLEALLVTTGEVRKGGRTSPPGARWISYAVPAAESAPPPAAPRRRRRTPPTAMVLTLDAAALPSHHQAVLYGHVLRSAALHHRGTGSTTLSGRVIETELPGDVDGPVRRDNHAHAHYLVLDTDGDRLLDTAVVWAPEGLDDDDLAALGSIRRLTHGEPGFRPVRVAAQGAGSAVDLIPSLVAPRGAASADTWRSGTPFAPYRHRGKRLLEDFLRDEVARELETRSLPGLISLELIGGDWLSFRRRRSARQAQLPAYGLQVTLSEPIAGPLSFGALSHFGLGLFTPVHG